MNNNTEPERDPLEPAPESQQELENINDFDYVVVNDEVDQAVADIVDIMRVEHMRTTNRKVSLNSNE